MKSLAARLVITYVALIVAMTAGAGIGILSLTRKYFVDAERQSILVQARVVARSCDDACVATGNAALAFDQGVLPPASNVSRVQQNAPSDYSVDPIESEGSGRLAGLQALVPSSITVISAAGQPSTRSESVTAALAGKEVTALSAQNVVAVVPIRRGSNIVGAVQATGSLDNVQSVLDDVRRQVLIALVACGLLATLIGVWRARAIAKPVRALTIAAHELSAGNFDTPLPPIKSADELSELTTAFDTLRNAVRSELQARSAFVGDASHELRTPLTAMRGAVEILRSDAGSRPEVRQRFLSSLDTEMNRLLSLVEDLLTLNQADHGVDQHSQPLVQLEALVRDAVTNLQPLATRRGIVFALDAEGVTLMHGNDAALRQLFINLLDNAMVHAPNGKRVEVCFASTGTNNMATIEIRDYGPGIPAADREKVFERFTRLDSARSRTNEARSSAERTSPKGGAGLGLAIARTIARDHGGDITIHEPADQLGGTLMRVALFTGNEFDGDPATSSRSEPLR
jgi:signal transduction histidine kinase